MTTVIRLDSDSGTFTGDGKGDTVTEQYRVDMGAVTNSSAAALVNAQTIATGDRPPLFNQRHPVVFSIFATSFNVVRNPIDRNQWDITVTYTSPDSGSSSTGNHDLHPLLRPPKFRLDYIEKQIVIENAMNVEALTGKAENGDSYERPAGTWGPIVNGVKQETIEPQLDTVWYGVITVIRFLPDLTGLMQLNKTYQLTTNSSTVLGLFEPRTLKYQVTQAGEEQIQDDIPYFQVSTSIEIQPTTDRKVQSTGLKYLDYINKNDLTKGLQLQNATDDKGNETGEPVFIGLDGQKSTDEVIITYRHLKEVDYSPLVT